MYKENALAFLLGTAIGGIVAWKLSSDKYLKEFKKELDEYKKCNNDTEKTDDILSIKIDEDESIDLFNDGYIRYGSFSSNNKEEPIVENNPNDVDGISIISSEEFGEYDEYETFTFKYFTDGVVLDEYEEEVDDLGISLDEYFNNQELDALYIRDENKKCEYEIYNMHITYTDPDFEAIAEESI